MFVGYDRTTEHATQANSLSAHTHTHTLTNTSTHISPDLRPVASVEHSEKEYPVGSLGATKV